MTRLPIGCMTVVLAAAMADLSFAVTAQEILSRTGIQTGLCAVVGCGDGSLPVSLHNDGRMLVSALATDAASWQQTRQAILSAGVYGLVSVDMPLSTSRLPYGDFTVNLLVADLAALGAGAPSQAEIRRVLAPHGKAYVNQSGAWSTIDQGIPSGMDEFRHFYHSADGNPVSQDLLVRPSNRLRWMGPGNTGGTGGPQGLLFANGYNVVHYKEKTSRTNLTDKASRNFTEVLNATNGIPVWRKEAAWAVNAAISGSALVVGFSNADYFQAYDLATGTLLHEFTEAGAIWSGYKSSGKVNHIQCYGTTILIPNRDKLFAFDASSYQLKWTHTAIDSAVVFQVVDTVNNRIFVAEGPDNQRAARWDGGPINYLVALNGADGTEVWRTNEWVNKAWTSETWAADTAVYPGIRQYPNCSQMIYANGDVYVFGACGIIAAYGDPFLARVNAATGQVYWYIHYQTNMTKYLPSRWAGDAGSFAGVNYSATSYWVKQRPIGGESGFIAKGFIFWDGHPCVVQPTDLRKINLDGTIEGNYIGSQENGRCNRTWATENYCISHQTHYLTPDDREIRNTITRSGCAQGGIPAYGAVHFVSGWCTCEPFLFGRITLSSETMAEPVAEGSRLSTAPALASATGAVLAFPATNALVHHWGDYYQFDFNTTIPAVTAGDLTLSVRRDEQRIVADKAGSVQWTFLAAGRITSAPIVTGRNVVFGSHDGWVYALDPANGSLKWRFLAAPNEEKVVAFGQAESRWPVWGVVEYDGRIYCAAGRTAELDGGVYVWGLDPSNGNVQWRTRFYSPPLLDGKNPNRNWSAKNNCVVTGIESNATGVALTLSGGMNRDTHRAGILPLLKTNGNLPLDISAWDGKVISPRDGLQPVSLLPSGKGVLVPSPAPLLIRMTPCARGYMLGVSGTGEHTIRLVDVAGRVLFSGSGNGEGSYQVDLARTGAGMYYVHVRDSRSAVVRAVMISGRG